MQKLLLILLAGLFLVPDPAGILAGPAVEPCQCEPVMCHCSGHDHGAAHGPMCAFANGGRCGMKSADISTADPSSHSDILLPEMHAAPGLIAHQFEVIVPVISGKPGYEAPATPPPRFLA